MLTPKQKEVLDAFNETFNQELEILQRRKELIHTWKSLRTEEALQKMRDRLLHTKDKRVNDENQARRISPTN
tara:strand:- start:74 stop:289 length:216 start_codon:yes stop_codon:yes gene_type:complete